MKMKKILFGSGGPQWPRKKAGLYLLQGAPLWIGAAFRSPLRPKSTGSAGLSACLSSKYLTDKPDIRRGCGGKEIGDAALS